MVFREPEERVANEEVPNLVASVVKDQCSPIHVFALTRIGVLIKRRSLKSCQGKLVFRKMAWHPIEYYADAGLMESVHEVSEFIGISETGRWCEISGDLI